MGFSKGAQLGNLPCSAIKRRRVVSRSDTMAKEWNFKQELVAVFGKPIAEFQLIQEKIADMPSRACVR